MDVNKAVTVKRKLYDYKATEHQETANLPKVKKSQVMDDNSRGHYEMELDFAKQNGNKIGEGRANGNLGNHYYSLGQYDKAVEQHEIHLSIAKQIGDKIGEGSAYSSLACCYHSLAQYDKAMKYNKLHFSIATETGDKVGEGSANGNLGNCCYSLGQYDKALEHYGLYLNIAKHTRDKVGEGRAYGSLGNCYHSLGQYEKAAEHYELHLNIAKDIGDKVGEGGAYGNLGCNYLSLGQYEKAKELHQLRLNIAIEIGDKAGQGRAYGSLGSCYACLGKYDKALECHESHLNIAEEIKDKAGEGGAHGNLGTCYCYLGQYDKAIKHHELNLNIAKEIGDKAGEGTVYRELGCCYRRLGKYDRAIQQHELHLDIAKQIGDKSGEGIAYGNLGNCYSSLKQFGKAESELRNSERCFQELFKNAPSEDTFKVSFLETFSKVITLLIEVLLAQGKTTEAFICAEEGRSRALAELMLKRHRLQYAEVSEHKVLELPEILDMVKAIDSAVVFFTFLTSDICLWVIKPNGDIIFKNRCFKVPPESKNYHLPKNLYVHVQGLIALIMHSREFLRSRSLVKCEDRSLAVLYPEEGIEEINSEQSYKLPSAETPEGTTAVEPGAPRDAPSVAHKMPGMSATPSEEAIKPKDHPLKELYQILLEPVRHLVEDSKVVLVPDGPLSLVPFSALMDENGSYVAESLQIRVVPSLSTAKMIMGYQQEPASQSCPLIVGDPDLSEVKMGKSPIPRLPNAKEEARMIGQLLNVQPLTAEKATLEAVLAKLESANLVHVAAHGDANRGEILLAPGTGMDKENLTKEDLILTISHLEKKRLKAKLVVLSCCHSGRGEVKSEGLIGIARAFLGAGARAVLATIWALDDEATLFFMREFYKSLVEGERANKAVNRARKAMLKHARFSNPYYWAPFVLVGDDVIPFSKS